MFIQHNTSYIEQLVPRNTEISNIKNNNTKVIYGDAFKDQFHFMNKLVFIPLHLSVHWAPRRMSSMDNFVSSIVSPFKIPYKILSFNSPAQPWPFPFASSPLN